MILSEVFVLLKNLGQRSRCLQQIPTSFGYDLLSTSRINQTTSFQSYCNALPSDRITALRARLNKVTAKQSKLTNNDSVEISEVSAKDEDLFGFLDDEERPVKPKKVTEKLKSLSTKSRDENCVVGRVGTKHSSQDENTWSAVFGTLDPDSNKPELKDDSFEDDKHEIDESEQPYRRLASEGRKHIPYWYGQKIAKLGKAGKVYEAVQVLEEEMLKQDRVLPSLYVFTVLIGVLGRNGYTKKAFKAFNQMKQFGLVPENPVYTSLFNACSNSPWPEDGLKRASDLRQLMNERELTINITTYNAMIKAFAKCGDLRTAFEIVDEAIEAGQRPDAHCYSSLLIACASDKDAGLKHAIEVWRLMRKRKITPNSFHYNLFLRVIRDCSVGDANFMKQLISGNRSSQPNQEVKPGRGSSKFKSKDAHYDRNEEQPSTDVNKWRERQERRHGNAALAPAGDDFESPEIYNSSPTDLLPVDTDTAQIPRGASVFDVDIPNLLNPRPRYDLLVGMRVPQSCDERLALFGGLPGILSHMARDRAAPDIKTFTLLLETISSNTEMEADLLSAMAINKVKPDVGFFNLMIRKRNMRRDYDSAKEVLNFMEKLDLKPDYRTFGCLAMGCPEKQDAVMLFEKMEKFGLFPTPEVFDILVFQSNMDFSYKRELLIAMKTYKVQPNENLIKKLENQVSKARELVVKMERGEPVPDICSTDKFRNGFSKFVVFYKPWLLSTNLEPEAHPWARFVQPTPVMPPDEEEEKKALHPKKSKKRYGKKKASA